MPLIQTADQRMQVKTGRKLVIGGPSGIGKTSLAWTLNPEKTLFVDMEAGMLALEGWQGDSINVRSTAQQMGLHPWEFLRDFACLVSGPNPAVLDESRPYSQKHFTYVANQFGPRDQVLGKYDHLFYDSITQTGRYSFGWSQTQPEAFSEKTGKPDNRGAYGLHKQEMIGMLSHLQHCPDKDIVLVGILQTKTDDYGRKTFDMQIEGQATGLELPGIVDEVISMVELATDEGQKYRAFVTHTINPWGYPAKDRSGRLDVVEKPHLGELLDKLNAARRTDTLNYAMPAQDGATAQPQADETAATT